LLTDKNDIELTILCSDTLERFLAEYTNPDKITAIQNETSLSLREILVRSASVIGTLLWLSKAKGWNLSFEEMSFRFDGRNVDIDLDRQIEHLRGRSQGTTMPRPDEVKADIDTARRMYAELLDHTRGCDLCEVLSKGVHDVFGRNHHNLGRGGPAVAEVIRAAYSKENFEQTQLYADIRAWEKKRTPLTVFGWPAK